MRPSSGSSVCDAGAGSRGWTAPPVPRILWGVFYWLVTLLIGLLIVGYGLGFALGCRLPPAEEGEVEG